MPPLPTVVPGGTLVLHLGDDRIRQQPGGFTVHLPADLPDGAIKLHPGERRKGITVTLEHVVSICGHVTHDTARKDEYGRDIGPAVIVPSDTSVVFYRYNPEFGVLQDETRFDTNKDGSFEITDLAPGTYYLKAYGYPGTWYPGTVSFAQAKPIVVGAGQGSACNIDIQQNPDSSCSTGQVAGQIDSNPLTDRNRYSVLFLEHNPEGASASMVGGPVPMYMPGAPKASAAGDSFKANICPREYDVVLAEEKHGGGNIWGNAPAQKIIYDSKTVKVVAREISQVTLTPHPMASIDGELRLEGTTREEICPNCQAINVSILRKGNGEFQTVTLSEGNHFNLRNVTPGEYQLFIATTKPEKAFLDSILVDGVAAHGRRFVIPEAKPVSMTVTLSGDLSRAAGHLSPDARDRKRWQTEGMRPLASVAGKVLGEKNAVYTVRLLPLGYNSNAPAQFSVITAADGSFHFDGVPPGVYRLRAHNKDYVRFDYGALGTERRGTPLLISPGARIADLNLLAPRASSICGRVVDAKGEPQGGLRMWHRGAGEKKIYSYNPNPSKEGNTDSDGYFRMDGLVAGDYVLYAVPSGPPGPIRLSGDGKLFEAAPFHIEDGKDLGCAANSPLELHVPAYNDHYSVSGAVIGDLPARVGDRFVADLKDAFQDDTYGQGREVNLDADHSFHFKSISPGRYRLSIYGLYGPEPKPVSGGVRVGAIFGSGAPLKHLVASQLVTVTDDVDDLKLLPLTLPSVVGTVHIARPPGNWKDFKPSDLKLELVPHRKNGSLDAQLKDREDGQGELALDAADAGEYELRIGTSKGYPVARSLFVQSVRLNDKEVNPRFITLPQDGVVKLQVELGSEMASVQAHLSVDQAFARPVLPLNERCGRPGGDYSVVLLPDPLFSPDIESEPEQFPRYQIGFSHGISCKGPWDGKVQDVPPGNYFAIAVKDNSVLELGTPDMGSVSPSRRRFLGKLAAIATRITLKPGEILDLNLDDVMIEAARIAAEAGVPDEQENLRPATSQACCGR